MAKSTLAPAAELDAALAAYKRGDFRAALAALQPLAEQGEHTAQYVLGLMHEHGQGVAQDLTLAMNWYRKAAAQNDARAQFNLGWIYENAPEQGEAAVSRDMAEAIRWYSLAAEQGLAEARYNLGAMYAQGRAGAPDYARALRWFRLAADQGNAAAQYNIGVMHHRGRGVAQDFPEAMKWYELAARQGMAEAQANLGVMFEKGEGVAKNFSEALRWSLLAAEQGDIAAQYNAAVIYNDTSGALRDYTKALHWFRRAAEGGHLDAQINLGLMYHEGRGVAQDHAEASKWFRLAAERGDVNAQANLAQRYRQGLGVEENETEAIRWLRLAAEQGNAGAWLNLGVYAFDDGDTAEAIACYDRALAIEPGSAQARFNRGLAYLTLGDYERGWAGYEARWETKDPKIIRPGRRWLGEDLAGKTVLVSLDQGFGDALQFVRVLPRLKRLGARVVFETYSKLSRLMQSAAGIDEIILRDEPPPAFDFYCPLVSVAAVLKMNSQSDFDIAGPYLRPPAGAGAKLGPALAASAESFKVGIAWSGNVDFPGDRKKSTSLANFLPLAAVPGVRLYSLQFGPRAEQLKTLGVGAAIGDLTPLIDDFADTAVALQGLDLLISVDTALVHLAGAIGRPAWVVLHPGADFRWLRDRDDSPWYPSLRLFRMAGRQNWENVMARVAAELAKVVASRQLVAEPPSA